MDTKKHEEERDWAGRQAARAVDRRGGAEKGSAHGAHQRQSGGDPPGLPGIAEQPKPPEPGQQPSSQAPVVIPAKALIPGGNNVPADEWERVKQHPVVKEWLEAGILSEGNEADTSKPEGPRRRRISRIAVPKAPSSSSTPKATARRSRSGTTPRPETTSNRPSSVAWKRWARVDAAGGGGSTWHGTSHRSRPPIPSSLTRTRAWCARSWTTRRP